MARSEQTGQMLGEELKKEFLICEIHPCCVLLALGTSRVSNGSWGMRRYVATCNLPIPIATTFDLTLDAFGRNVSAGSGSGGHLALSEPWGAHLEPSPSTPTDLAGPWGVLARAIKSSLERRYPEQLVVVSPALEQGAHGATRTPSS